MYMMMCGDPIVLTLMYYECYVMYTRVGQTALHASQEFMFVIY